MGALPQPPGTEAGGLPQRIRTAILAQEAAGLEPITDGRLGDPMFEAIEAGLVACAAAAAPGTAGTIGTDLPGSTRAIVEGWRYAASQTTRAVKQALPGPYSIARRAGGAGAASRGAGSVALDVAAAVREAVEALAAAGCPLVEIEETEAHRIGPDEAERALFVEAHRRLTDGITGTHLTLSIVGGSAWDAGLETVLAGAYPSLALDLIAGPDNWNLVTRLPGDRGVIAGVLPSKDSPADAREMLLWAARNAAAARGRGLDRVGLGSAGSWANLTWEAAVAKLQRLGDAARLAATPGGEGLARQLDPRAVNARSAALGQVGGTGAAGAPRRRRTSA